MKQVRLGVIILFTLWAQIACTHKGAIVTPVLPIDSGNNTATDTVLKPASGTYLCMGTAYKTGEPNCPDAFVAISINYANRAAITAGNNYNTYYMQYNKTYSSPNSIAFSWTYSTDFATLYYDPTTKHFSFRYGSSTSSGGVSTEVTDSGYKPNPFLRSYLNNICGTRNLIGTVYDSQYSPAPHFDTSYDVNANITFTAINDSTIHFNKHILANMGDSILHYKYTDSLNEQIVWQTFHTQTVMSTLRYNYTTQALTFEQWYYKIYTTKSVTLINH
jgi:hypothetical protein